MTESSAAGSPPVAVRHDLEHVPLAPPSRTTGLAEVFRRRYLLRLMVNREIKARYAGSAFGLAWSYINPFTRFLTFYFVFGLLIGRGGGLSNFAIHLFAGMVVVQYFTETVNAGTKSLLKNRGVVQKMAMPREMFPFASMLVSLWHTFPMVVILVTACLLTGWGDNPNWVPDAYGMSAALLGFAITMVLGTALGLMFACVNVIFRDFSRIVATFINMVPFSVPMMYPYYLITERFGTGIWHTIYLANPMATAVQLIQRGFWYPTCDPDCAVVPNTTTPLPEFVDDLMRRGLITLAVCVVLLVLGQYVFSRMEKNVPERM